jgi:hypothetical protein
VVRFRKLVVQPVFDDVDDDGNVLRERVDVVVATECFSVRQLVEWAGAFEDFLARDLNPPQNGASPAKAKKAAGSKA